MLAAGIRAEVWVASPEPAVGVLTDDPLQLGDISALKADGHEVQAPTPAPFGG